MVVESVTWVLGYTASGSEIHAPLGSRTGRCELVRHFSVPVLRPTGSGHQSGALIPDRGCDWTENQPEFETS